MRDDARHCNEWSHPALICRWRFAHAAREEDAEAAQAGEADLHADLSDRALSSREQMFRELESRRLSKLMRRGAEYRPELPNEMEGRNLNVARELVNREWRLTHFEQQVAGATEATESFMPQEHARSVAGLPGYRL
jgi:hypothetical protein